MVALLSLLLYNLDERFVEATLSYGFLPAAGLFHIGLVCAIVGLAKGDEPRRRSWGAFAVNAAPVLLFWLFIYGLYLAFKSFT